MDEANEKKMEAINAVGEGQLMFCSDSEQRMPMQFLHLLVN